MQETRRRRQYRYASVPNDALNLLLFVLLFTVMIGTAYVGMHHPLGGHTSGVIQSLFHIKGLSGG